MRPSSLGLLALSLAACGAPSSSPSPYGLALHLSFVTPSQPPGGVMITSAALHLRSIRAVSDRSSSDDRATVAGADLPLGATFDTELAAAPPGLYSSLNATVAADDGPGIDVQGIFENTRLHLTLTSAAFEAGCPAPAMLEQAHPVELWLAADMTSWFDGVDLAKAIIDSDDNGIVISDDDNQASAKLVTANLIHSFQLACDQR